jgi:hypothetical protein
MPLFDFSAPHEQLLLTPNLLVIASSAPNLARDYNTLVLARAVIPFTQTADKRSTLRLNEALL